VNAKVQAEAAPRGAGREPRHGRARFRIEADGTGVSFAADQFAQYPFHVTRVFHMDEAWPELATLYLQSVSGGLFADDRLELDVAVARGAALHLTSQSATKVHSMTAGEAHQNATLTVEAGGYLEYLTDPVILFPRARLESRIEVTCAPGGTAILADSFLSHDPAGGVEPAFGMFATEVVVRRPEEAALVIDRFRVEPAETGFGNPGLDGGCQIQGTLYVVDDRHPGTELAAGLREAMAGREGVRAGASTLPGGAGAWLRVLATEGEDLRSALHAAAVAARALCAGKPMGRARK
jgi:urease accessory protein